ncbi:MAG: sialate O-acetylesterase [Lewinella sp.]|uniref:sialate O-acetylesterase n=1 Tax=Lewinella sp. TaxID=2004506 RepID=UPI003D6A9855
MKIIDKHTLGIGFRLASLLFILFCAQQLSAKIQLPKLISNGMVLQRHSELNIWGWADKGEVIAINFLSQRYETTTDATGRWSVPLTNLEAGGPYQLTVSSTEEKLVIENILIGDVWLCSGQSNMELSMQRVSPLYEDIIAKANHPNIRYFEVPKTYNFKQANTHLSSGEWITINPQSIQRISAVAYFFATELEITQEIPIGLINASLGGSPAEAWISPEALKVFREPYAEALRFRNDKIIDSIQLADQERSSAWYTAANTTDLGNNSPGANWSMPMKSIDGWDPIQLPGDWSSTPISGQAGIIWVRRTFEVPATWTEKEANLVLGRIVDADSVFVNGTYVGHTTYQYPPRIYSVPAGVLHTGKNSIVVRLVTNNGNAAFVTDKSYQITCGEQTIDLYGLWHYRQGTALSPLASQTFIRWKPTGLFNAMIAPLIPYRIKGAIWYQGESNVNNAEQYQALMTTLIGDWRKGWNQGDFPFIIVQLANFQRESEHPIESPWAKLRDAQRRLLNVPNTALAVTSDLGEWNDIHPLNKKDVGYRLALAARQLVYKEQIVASGPLYESYELEGHRIRLFFESAGTGLIAEKGGPLKHFAIAGEDGQYVWAEARIEGSSVVVWSNAVEHPKSVRYGWSDNPLQANLYNKEGLPASTFSTE